MQPVGANYLPNTVLMINRIEYQFIPKNAITWTINNFDIISASSGSVITIILIEMCYDNNLITEENWFEKYVVKTIHDFFNTNYIMSIFKLMYLDYNNVSLIHKFWTTLGTFYNKIPKIEKSSKSKNIKKPIFCYTYFNTDTLTLS